MSGMARYGLMLVLLCGPLRVGAEEALGRLFLTPEQRAGLERQRRYDIPHNQVLEDALLRLDGVVVRSSGKKTIWFNGRTQHDNASPSGLSAKLSSRDPGRALLVAGNENPISLRVGETVNLADKKQDRLASGALAGTHALSH